MEPYEDHDIKSKCNRIRELIDRGEFVVANYGHRYPILNNDKVGIRYTRQFSEKLGRHITGETSWGLFDRDNELSDLWVLADGREKIPEGFLPQIKPAAGEAVICPQHVVINANGRSVEADIQFDESDYYNSAKLRIINEKMIENEIPVMVWRLIFPDIPEEEKGKVEPIKIMTEHIAITASSAVVDEDDDELVATQIVPVDKQSLKALRATLAQNSKKNWISIGYKGSSYGGSRIRGSKKGFLTIGSSTMKEGAVGAVVAMLNPVTGDPQLWSEKHFYIVTVKDEDLFPKFVKHLDLCIPWPILESWSEYLLEEGTNKSLIDDLVQYGDEFDRCIKVQKSENHWQEIIETGLETGKIKIEESAVG